MLPAIVGNAVSLQRAPHAGQSPNHLPSHRGFEQRDVDDPEKEKELRVLLQTDEYVTLDVVQLQNRHARQNHLGDLPLQLECKYHNDRTLGDRRKC